MKFLINFYKSCWFVVFFLAGFTVLVCSDCLGLAELRLRLFQSSLGSVTAKGNGQPLQYLMSYCLWLEVAPFPFIFAAEAIGSEIAVFCNRF